MTRPEDNKDTLAALREVPTEVSLEQVGHMVAAFPLAVGAMAWLISTLKFNLNTILMTSSATLIVGTSAYILSTAAPAETTKAMDMPTPAVVELVAELPEPEPAVVFELPPAKPNPPAPKKEPTPNEDPALACAPISFTLKDDKEETTVTVSVDKDFNVTASTTTTSDDKRAPAQAGQRSFDLRGFTGVAIMGSANVFVEEGDFSVVADGDQEVLDRLEITTEGNLLKVGFARSRGPVTVRGRSDIRIRMPRVDELLIMGSGNISAGSFAKAAGLKLMVMGSGGITFNGIKDAQELEVIVEGSGDVSCQQMNIRGKTSIIVQGSGDAQVGGSTDRIDVIVQGSGDVHATNLKAKNGGRVIVSGSGDAHVHSDGNLELITTGSGRVHTSGSAGQVRSRGVGKDSR